MLDTLHFNNQFTRELPVYPNAANFRRQVNGACYSRAAPTPVAAPHLIAYAHEVSHVELISELLEVLQQVETDMTIFFRRMALLDTSPATSDEALLAPFWAAYCQPETLGDTQHQRALQWLRRYAGQVRTEGVPEHERRARMDRVNPKYVLRNYLAQLTIDCAEQNDYGLVTELLEVLRRPCDEQPNKEIFVDKRPGCSMLSCIS